MKIILKSFFISWFIRKHRYIKFLINYIFLITDKKPESVKEKIDREYKEIDECKGIKTKEKKNSKAKMVSTEHKPSGLDRIISSCKEKKICEKFASTPNESIILTDTVSKWFSIQSRIINGKIPIVAKLVFLNFILA